MIKEIEEDGWYLEAAQRYRVVFEHAPNNWAAYVPDLPGCVAAGDTREETAQLIQEAVALHLESMEEDGEPWPAPGSVKPDRPERAPQA